MTREKDRKERTEKMMKRRSEESELGQKMSEINNKKKKIKSLIFV